MSSRATTFAPAATSDRTLAIVLAGFLGLALVFMSGFAGSDVLHAAAHDFRHANNNPCH